MKLTNVIYLYIRMFSIKNGINTRSLLYTESHKSFPILCRKFLKSILLCLYCINYNKINIYHSDIQRHVFHEKWLKQYKYFLYRFAQKFFDTLQPFGEKF